MSEESASVHTSLKEILRGGSLLVIGRILSNVAGFLLNWVLVQALGTTLYGVYAYGRLITSTVTTLTTLGMDKGMLRFLPASQDDDQKDAIVTLSFLSVLAFSGLTSVIIYWGAPLLNEYTLQDDLFVDVLRILSITIPFYTLSRLFGAVFRSIKFVGHDIFISQVSPRIARLLAAVVGLVFGYQFVETVVALAIASAIVFLIAAVLFFGRTDFQFRPRLDRETTVDLYNFSFPLMFSQAATFLYKRVDVFMVGIFLSSTEVGAYNIAVLVSTVLVIPLGGINQLFPPIASELYSNGEMEKLQTIYRIVTRWTVTISLFGAIFLAVHRTEVLLLFDEEVAMAATVLSLLVVGQFVSAATGPCNYILMMADHQYLIMINQWFFGIFNIVLNYYLLHQIGLTGAAIATATSLSLLNVVRLVEAWHFEGVFPYTLQFAKPIVAGVVSAFPMVVLGRWFAGFSQLLVNGFIGCLTFLVALYLLGIEDEDRSFFRQEVLG